MIDSRTAALDALHSAIAGVRGASDALCARASSEGDDLASMLSESLDMQAGRLSDVEKWLEGHPA